MGGLEMKELLVVKNLKTQFKTEAGLVKAVDGVSFTLNKQEIIGLVGESGCGKSVTCLSIMKLVRPPGEVVDGEVIYQGENLLKYSAKGKEMSSIRGAEIAMIFQEPMTSLNPSLTIGQQLIETMEQHLGLNYKAACKRAADLMEMVGIPKAVERLDDYPHQFSGGMRQRVMIAMALSCNPKVLIADEPTTALDVTTQAQLLELLKDMVEKTGTSLILVTHNMGLVARYAHRVYVMYAGRVIETSTTKEIFANPLHPYTRGLLECIPRLDEEKARELVPIKGLPPNLINMPPTCAFLPRCPYRVESCYREPWAPLRSVDGKYGEHYTRCDVNTLEKVR
jgi:oligopeptide/dipeptide ABC transporter ATP-binding protein